MPHTPISFFKITVFAENTDLQRGQSIIDFGEAPCGPGGTDVYTSKKNMVYTLPLLVASGVLNDSNRAIIKLVMP